VQTSLAFERRPKLRERILIQEAAIPRAVINLFKYLLKDRQLDNSMVMLGMGIDDAKGEVVFHDKRWQIKWPGLKKSGFRKMMFREFERVAQAHGGWYKRLKEFGDNLVSVHPLGACCMADDPQDGVVNQLGQVYDGQQGGYLDYSGQPAIHPGLYVADGSVVSTPLGVNPYMTIAALSERIAHHITANPAHAHLFQPASTNAGTAKTSNNRR
jgi:cholesterol oxidase